MPPPPIPPLPSLEWWFAIGLSALGCGLTMRNKSYPRTGLFCILGGAAITLFALLEWLKNGGWLSGMLTILALPGFAIGLAFGVQASVAVFLVSWFWPYLRKGGWYYPTWENREFRRGQIQKLTLRTERGLKKISDFQEDLSVNRIDPGSYAFADAYRINIDPSRILVKGEPSAFPGSDFELHRLKNGAVEILGFVTKQDAHAIHSNTTESDIRLFARKTSMVTELEAIPIQRILDFSRHSVRSSASRLDIKLAAPAP